MNALIVAAGKQVSSELSAVAKRAGAANIVAVYDAVAAKRMASERVFDLVIIYSENFADQAPDLARTIAARGEGGVILIESVQYGDDIERRLENDGVITLGKPISRTALYQAIKIVRATNNRISRLIDEKRDLLKKIDDMRLINRAKLLLMTNMNLDEAQAHRYIEKRAMDLRQSRIQVANEILKKYED